MSCNLYQRRRLKILNSKNDYSLEGFTLSNEQNDICKNILTNYGGIINSQAGTGKTLVSLSIAQHLINIDANNTMQVCIVCPVKAVNSFKKELTTKINQPFSIYTVKEYNIVKDARYHIFTYTKLSELEQFIVDYEYHNKTLILDEVHILGNKKNKAYIELARLRDKFKIVIGLTATPIMNELEELYNVVNYIKPGYLGTKKAFTDNYMIMAKRDIYTKRGKVKTWQCVGTKNEEQLAKVMSNIAFGMKKKYNLKWYFRKCELTDEEADAYIEGSQGLLNEELEPKAFSARLHDLQTIIDGSHPQYQQPRLSSKEKLLVSTLYEIMQRDESALLYVEYTVTVDRLTRILQASKSILNYNDIKFITGATPLQERTKLEKEMQPKTIVILTQAGRESMNLQKANNLIMYNIPYSTGSILQLIGRITRIDTKFDTQNVYILEVIDTIDTYKQGLVASKIDLFEAIFGEQTTMPDFSDDKFNIDTKALKRKYLWKAKRRR